ncbi:permease [Altererythrobacter sp. SALINAS58]|uniref:CBU_0592 family membrane protein n=1 Tax=Alteripontixanthobacter muriae TaxID=2705546 RepID=UPI001E43C4F9|nr:permease [Alteripontixanthobacter muriae]NTZ43018.1 permease [Alteripontixanthobacter muriae]
MTPIPIMHSDLANIVGFAGMVLIVAAYAYVTAAKQPNPFILHATNLVGAALLALSLLVNTNLPSLVLEGVWASVAIWGLVKAFRTKRRNRTESP